MGKYVKRKLGDFSKPKNLSTLSLDVFLKNFDENGLFPTAMSDKESVYPKVETGSAFKKDMKDDLAKAFNNQSFTKRCAILPEFIRKNIYIILYYIPRRRKVATREINSSINGNIMDI